MRRSLILILLGAMLLGLVACGDIKNEGLPEKLIHGDNRECSIFWGDDNSYTLQINDHSISGSYFATKYTDNSIVVLCEVDPAGINDGSNHLAGEFFLFSSDAESWEYCGEEYFGLMPGALFVTAEDVKNYLPIEVCDEYSTAQTEGIYKSTERPFDTLSIDDVTADRNILFSLFWFRTFSIDDCVGKAYGDYAVFRYNDINATYETWGVIRFNGDRTAKVTLINSNLPYLEQSAFEYKFRTPDEIIKDTENAAKSDLTRQDASYGWKNKNGGIYLSFNTDGTVKCYFNEPPYENMPLDGYTWDYNIHGETITINGYNYKYSSWVGTGADFAYSFYASGEDPFGIAGEYSYNDSGVYPVTKQNNNRNVKCWSCGQEADYIFNYQNGESCGICLQCASKCVWCGEPATKHYHTIADIEVFACDDCYEDILDLNGLT